ncbi:MAG: PP2C family protein-serine/threonine phosphatase [Pseudomonadota bacterium]
MKQIDLYKTLAGNVARSLPVTCVFLIKHHDGNNHLIDMLVSSTNINELEFPVTVLSRQTDSFTLAKSSLPETIQTLFEPSQCLIVSLLEQQPETLFLLCGLEKGFCESKVEQTYLLKFIDLIIENDKLAKINEAKEKKYQDYIKEVKIIKEKLLPAANYKIEGLDYATYYQPSIGGGGDYYDFVDLRPARRRAGYENPPLIWGFGLMDVSGHGPGAAVEVAMVDAILRTYEGQRDSGPADVLAYVNQHFFTRQSRGGYCTAFLCNYDAEADLFSYASAGHLPVLIKHHEGHVTVLESETGIPIGIERDYSWTTETTQLEQGDTIIIYTDGITEAESITGEQFGLDRLTHVLEESPAGSAEKLMSHFMNDYHQHINHSDEQDDQTLIMVTISS